MELLSLRKKDRFLLCELMDTNSAQIVALQDDLIKYFKNDVFLIYKKIIMNEGNDRKKYIKKLGEELGDKIIETIERFNINLDTNSNFALCLDDSTADLPWEISIIKKRPRKYFCEFKNIGRMRVYKSDRWRNIDIKRKKYKALIVGIDYDGHNERLEFPEKESEKISCFLKDKGFLVKLLQGKCATNEKIFNELRRGVEIFHFTGHGKTYREESTISTYCNEISTSQFRKNLTPPRVSFINACESSVERVHKKSKWDPYSWASAFIENGAEVFIGSLWPIEDETSTLFSLKFYNNLFNNKENSLGKAFTKARESIKYLNDPYYTWLAYVLYANPSLKIKSIFPRLCN